jgi:hypothetical protein
MSQQLAVAFQSGPAMNGDEVQVSYAGMSASQTTWDDSDLTQVTVTSHGRLHYEAQDWAKFRQTVTVVRGLRTIEFDVEIELLKTLGADPWTNNICSRMAWGEDAPDRYRGVHETRQAVRLERFAAPTFVEIENDGVPLCLLPQGIPFHRQSTTRILDTLLIVSGERARRFLFSIAIGAANPQSQAVQSMSPTRALPVCSPAPSSVHRFFQIEPKDVLILDSRPTWDEAGKCNGATLLLRETSSTSGQCKIHAPRDLSAANLIDLTGRTLQTMEFQRDVVVVDYHPFKLFGIQVSW